MNTTNKRKRAMILGALVADAAALGLHWIYSQPHIRKIAPEMPEFRDPVQENYKGVKAFYAHGGKRAGDQSQYGEALLLALRAVIRDREFDWRSYAVDFERHFGFGGAYHGYIDKPTRKTLINIMARSDDGELTEVPGVADVQLPAIARLPVVVARYAGETSLPARVEDAVRVTNNDELAVVWGAIVGRVLERALLEGTPDDPASLFLEAVTDAPEAQRTLVERAVRRREEDNKVATVKFGPACELDSGIPAAMHNLLRSRSYREAIRTNIYASGDSCGRAIFLGAVAPLVYPPPADEIPVEWVDGLSAGAEISSLLDGLLT